MSKLPWFKFYPADWRAEPALRMVSLEARGLWIECMCLMHEAEPYGNLIVRGIAIDVAAIASIVSAPEQVVRACLHELESAGVLSVNREGVMFCRRMVRDAKNRERAKSFGKMGGNPVLKNPVASNVYELPLKPPPKATLKLRGQSLESRRDADASVERVFDALWSLWPSVARKRHPQQKVRDAIAGQLKLGADPDQIIQAGHAHVAERVAQKGPEIVKGLVPWLATGLWKNWAGPEDAKELTRRLWVFETHGEWRPEWGPRPLSKEGNHGS